MVQIKYALPITPWIQDPESKRLAELAQQVIIQLIRPFTIATVVRGGIWRLDEVDEKLQGVRKDFSDTDLHCWMPL